MQSSPASTVATCSLQHVAARFTLNWSRPPISYQTGITATSLASSTFHSNLQDCHFSVLHSTPSLSSVPSGTHHVQRPWLCSTLPAINTSRCAIVQRTRTLHNSTTELFKFVARAFGTVCLKHCVLPTTILIEFCQHLKHTCAKVQPTF